MTFDTVEKKTIALTFHLLDQKILTPVGDRIVSQIVFRKLENEATRVQNSPFGKKSLSSGVHWRPRGSTQVVDYK